MTLDEMRDALQSKRACVQDLVGRYRRLMQESKDAQTALYAAEDDLRKSEEECWKAWSEAVGVKVR